MPNLPRPEVRQDGFTLEFGFRMAGFTEDKQALHDRLAGTLVVKK